jgi:hypothetical protein
MNFDLSNLAVKEDTADIQLRHPATGELLWADDAQTLPVSVTVYGPAAKARREATTVEQNKALQRSAKGIVTPAAQVIDESNRFLAKMTLRFNNLELGGVVPTTEDDFKAIYSKAEYNWLKDQVNAGAGDLSLFMGK